MTKNLIDFEELLERTENDKDLMRDLLTIFKEEFPERLQALRNAVASLNAPQVVLEAHALKGMLSNLAAVEAAAAVAELERLARDFMSPFHILRPSRKSSRNRWKPAWPRCPDENPDCRRRVDVPAPAGENHATRRV